MATSIRTHAMLKDADGDYDAAALASTNCKIFFPCDEVSGTTINDSANSTPIVLTDPTTAFTKPHAVDFGLTGAAPTSGTVPAIDTQCILVVSAKVLTAAAFFTMQFGTSSNEMILVTEQSAKLDIAGASNDVVTATSSAASAGDIVTSAAVLRGSTLYHYRSINGAGITLVNSKDATAFLAAAGTTLSLNNTVTPFSVAVDQSCSGIALLSYASNMPSLTTIVAALNTIDQRWHQGRKAIPAELL